MSARATFWAWSVTGIKSSQKLVLLCLADNHNDDSGQCNPSVAFISDKTGLNRKTILQALADLEAEGLIEGKRRFGATTNFRLKTNTNIGTGETRKRPRKAAQPQAQTSAENGTGLGAEKPVPKVAPVPNSVPVPKTDITSTVFTTDQYQKRDTEPKTEPTKNLKQLNTLDFSGWPEEPSEQVWADYKKHRKEKRASINQTVINRMAGELKKLHAAGWSVDDALGEQMHRGWQGLKADWILKNGDLGNATHQPNRKESLAERSWRESEEVLADIEAREAGERSVAEDAPVVWPQVGKPGGAG